MALWTPDQLGQANLIGWYDPSDDANVVISNSKVVTLKDKSGNGRDVSSSGGGAATTTINGLRALVLDGSFNTVFGTPGSALIYSTDLCYAAVIAVAASQTGSYARMLSFGQSSEYGGDYNTNGYLDVSTGGSGSTLAETNGNYANGTSLSTTPQVLDAVFTGVNNTITVDQNGTQSGSAGVNYNFYVYSKYMWLFGAQSGYTYVTGTGGEVIVGASRWTGDTLARVQGYLAWKWGTQASLPAGHAYKNAAPTVGASQAVSGQVAGSQSEIGAVQAVMPLTGGVAGAQGAQGLVAATRPASGVVVGQQSGAGSTSRSVAVAGSVTGQQATTGTVVLSSPVAGAITGVQAITGAIGVALTLSGAVAGLQTTTGAIDQIVLDNSVTGMVTGSCSVGGAVQLTFSLRAGITGMLSIWGATGYAVPLAGGCNGFSYQAGLARINSVITGSVGGQQSSMSDIGGGRYVGDVILYSPGREVVYQDYGLITPLALSTTTLPAMAAAGTPLAQIVGEAPANSIVNIAQDDTSDTFRVDALGLNLLAGGNYNNHSAAQVVSLTEVNRGALNSPLTSRIRVSYGS